MRHLFLSYSRRDQESIGRLARVLNDLDCNVWTDVQIEAGKQWRDEIDKAIENAEAFLIAISPYSVYSDHVRREFLVALEAKLAIFPIQLAQVPKHDLWSVPLLDFQWIDLQKDFHDGVERLLRALWDARHNKARKAFERSESSKQEAESILKDPKLGFEERLEKFATSYLLPMAASRDYDFRLKEFQQRDEKLEQSIAHLNVETSKLLKSHEDFGDSSDSSSQGMNLHLKLRILHQARDALGRERSAYEQAYQRRLELDRIIGGIKDLANDNSNRRIQEILNR